MNTKLKTGIFLIRSFNRLYTNIFGPIDQHIFKSEFSLSEVWVLYGIEETEDCTSKMLSDTLYMDTGYLDCVIRRFEKCGFTRKEQPAIDGRAYNLYTTDTGRERMTQLNNASSSQTAYLLKPLLEIDCGFLAAHMTAIEILSAEGRNVNPQDITIRMKICPGDIGYTTHLYGHIYQEEYGHFTTPEHYMADSFVQFISQYQSGNNRL